MRTLDLADRLWPALVAGEKRATIRWGEAPIRPGRLRFVRQDAAASAVVEVRRVTRMALREAARFLGREADWPDDALLAGMREHYPAITLDDTVQVIEHGPPLRVEPSGGIARSD
ncbi:MAG: ASCH domain-containing protein [Paracoccaceae bacterium]